MIIIWIKIGPNLDVNPILLWNIAIKYLYDCINISTIVFPIVLLWYSLMNYHYVASTIFLIDLENNLRAKVILESTFPGSRNEGKMLVGRRIWKSNIRKYSWTQTMPQFFRTVLQEGKWNNLPRILLLWEKGKNVLTGSISHWTNIQHKGH